MKRASAFPLWVYVAVALLVALAAFGIGQIAPRMGVPFVAAASMSWVAFNISRQRKWNKNV